MGIEQGSEAVLQWAVNLIDYCTVPYLTYIPKGTLPACASE